MLKRLASLLLVLSLLTACGTAVQIAAAAPSSVPPPVATPTPTATPAPSPTPQPSATPTPTPAPDKAPQPEAAPGETVPEVRKINSLHSWNPAHHTYHSTVRRNSEEVWGLLESLNPVAEGVREAQPIDLLGFLIVFRQKGSNGYDLIKESYYLTETQIYSEERGVLNATPEQCKLLHDFAKLNNAQENSSLGGAIPQWLCYMNPYSITEVALTGVSFMPSQDPAVPPKVTDISFTTSDPRLMLNMGQVLNSFYVQANSVLKSSGRLEPVVSDSLITIKLSFSSGVVYDLYITDDRVDTLSSDMDDTLSYKPAEAKTVERFRLHAEDIYYQLHPELEKPEHIVKSPHAVK